MLILEKLAAFLDQYFFQNCLRNIIFQLDSLNAKKVLIKLQFLLKAMEHPIGQFINKLFSQKPQSKRIQWTMCFIDQQYDTPEELASISENSWKQFENKLPLKIIETIKREALKLGNKEQNNFAQKNIAQKVSLKNPQAGAQMGSKEHKAQKQPEIYELSQKQIDKILKFMNKDMNPKDIAEAMDAEPGSKKEQAILLRINTLIRPPLPYPANGKKIASRDKDPTLPLFHYQTQQDFTRKYYTFLVIGETGSGKTTLLDAFVNYLNGMSFEDNWRWKLVDESHLNVVAEGISKTSKITEYYINDHRNQFNIKIIDTPGFGDTKGLKTDDQITDQFTKFFNEIPQLDYILLTIKATETRLNHRSKYIYDRVQNLFGKDASDHFILMCTFADGKTPNCLDIVRKEIKIKQYFVFNNSALYTPSDKGTSVTKFYWKMGIQSIKQFQNYVLSSGQTPLSLQMSKEVLETRKYLQQSIKTSQHCLKETMLELQIARKSLKSLQENKKKIEANGEYTEVYTRDVFDKVLLNDVYQMCQLCQESCCQICKWPPGAKQSACSYFNGGKNCPVCPGKCPKFRHIQSRYKITKRVVTQTKVIDLKKQFYEEGLKGVDLYNKQFDKKVKNLKKLIKKISDLSQEIKMGLKDLQKTALKPKLFTDKQFYEQMIKSEQQNKEQGWTDRVYHLREVVKNVEALEKISGHKTIYDMIPQLKKFDQEIKAVESGKKEKTDANCTIY